ncbi:hypothetical protein [Bacillus sp. MUM 116]|uniref:hypothetical protein n=1 Tax=Bacillus sp. MUM 116 TaxID=1678002 RepID=UPI00210A78B5|nr:hypothetical protein [Bacillus sp. MUM 116]
MARKTMEERLEELQKRKEQIAKQEKSLQAKIRSQERKERTRRLIEVGAIFEKYFEIEGAEEAEQVAIQFGEMIKQKKIIREDYVLLGKREKHSDVSSEKEVEKVATQQYGNFRTNQEECGNIHGSDDFTNASKTEFATSTKG